MLKKYCDIIKFLYWNFRFIFPPKELFLKNEIYLNGKRIYKLKNNNIRINIKGENNIIKLNNIIGGGKVVIDLNASRNCKIEFGRNNSISDWAVIRIKSYPHSGCEFQEGCLYIGNNNHFNGEIKFTVADSKDAPIIIGDNNLFAPRIEFKAVSDHLIYDNITKKQINIEKGIYIGNHNWLCEKTTFLNKAVIGSNCVVGMMSLVNKNLCEDNCIIAGIPANIRKKGINWNVSVNPQTVDQPQKIC